jgi:UDP-N-acetylglucosamine 1-carboxyvinyltransferase
MMAAALAEGVTVIENAAREPEVGDLAALLTAMGARLDGVGTGHIEIHGVPELTGAVHRVVPDRIEAGTLLVAGAITRGDVRVTNVVPDHLAAVLAKLEECGVMLETGPTWVRVRAGDRPRPADIVTSPFPGFPTDMQAQLMTLLGLADGQSTVTETIFENRFMHAAELARMGASITSDGSIAIIRGVESYQGAPVMASDLRASAALVLAGLAARGRTDVSRIYHLDRGYERLETKLSTLGARIERRP